MILLTNEEMLEGSQRVAKAQLKKVVEWLRGDCPHEWEDFHSGATLPVRERRHCPKCWQALLKEVE